MTYSDYDTKRNEIIDCAAVLFTKKGYEATSVNAILKQLGIAKGTFYYYFESKEEVMDAVIMRIIHSEMHRMQGLVQKIGMTPTQKLFAALFPQQKNNEKQEIVDILYAPNNALMNQRALQRTLELICPILAKIVEEGNACGEFSSEDPLHDMQFLVAGIQTIVDFSQLKDSQIVVAPTSVVNCIFHVLKMDEDKINRKELLESMLNNW